MKTDLLLRVASIMAKANEFKDLFNRYAYLWVDDRNEFMKQFLLYSHVLTQEEIDQELPGCLDFIFNSKTN